MRFGVSVQIDNGEREIYYKDIKKDVYLSDEIRFNVLIENPDSEYTVNWSCEKSIADSFNYNGWNADLKIEFTGRKTVCCIIRDSTNEKNLQTLEFKFDVVRGFRSI